ncbi:glycosyltransferase family 9 protein [Edaphobacter sp.]|uniref:glycosyltransferase family 9 protein n=1 Tax=Edaphobacter sp. TaxID=1934404 RepID=UPI002DBF61C4|nr:glycosyltransferase family 9 protein [Edaphobacter sp.]HEU5340298.1 glycosyltransferase family 9 protein [Edaphobacter sp.]
MCSAALGDTLLFSGVLRDLREWCDRQSGAEIEIVHFYMKQNRAAAELIVGADRRVLIDMTQPLKSIQTIRAEGIDVLLDFTSWQRLTALYSLMSGARLTAGFQTPGQYRGLGYDVQVEHRTDRHEMENFRALLRAVHIPAGLAPQVVVPAAATEPLPGGRDIVVFHLWASGALSHLREWPEDRWIALAEGLARPETVFAITGATGDLERIDPFVRRMKEKGLSAVPFVGTDGFISLSHLLRRARVVVSVNTGTMHLAAILDAPTVSLNGPTNNERWGPIGPHAVGVSSSGADCGYLNLGFEFNGQATDCMERISVESVLAAAIEVANHRANQAQWTQDMLAHREQ